MNFASCKEQNSSYFDGWPGKESEVVGACMGAPPFLSLQDVPSDRTREPLAQRRLQQPEWLDDVVRVAPQLLQKQNAAEQVVARIPNESVGPSEGVSCLFDATSCLQ